MAKNIILNVENRNTFGKKNRSLRRNGITPVHVYGLKSDSLSLQANEKDLISVLKSAGRTTPVSIKTKDIYPVIGSRSSTMPAYQLEPNGIASSSNIYSGLCSI